MHHVHFHIVPSPVFTSSQPIKDAKLAEEVKESNLAPVVDPTPPFASTTEPPPPNPQQISHPSHEDVIKLERNAREELDNEDAKVIAEKIRSKL